MRYVCRIAMCVMVMLAAVSSLSAQTKRGAARNAVTTAVTTKDHQMTMISARSGANTPYVGENAGLNTIFSNFATEYPLGIYWCCEGATISGPKSFPLDIEWWHAAAFTPTANATVKKIEVSVGYLSGNDASVILSLNADNAGIPGAELAQWNVSDLGEAGTCCSVQVGTSTGVTLSAGQQYWVVVSTAPDSDVNASWNVSENDQIDFFLNSGLTNQNSSGWVSAPTNPNVAFSVFGR